MGGPENADVRGFECRYRRARTLALVREVRNAQADRYTLTEIAKWAGMSRQRLHELLKEHPPKK